MKVKKLTITRGKITGIVIGLVMTLALFFLLVFIQRELLKDTEKDVAVIANRQILAGTVITKENVSDYFKEAEISRVLAIEETYSQKSELIGKYVKRTIADNEIIYEGIIGSEAEVLSQYENPTELSLAITEEAAAVAGTIRKGDTVNVYAALTDANGNQSFQLVLNNVLVNEVYDENMNKITMSDKLAVALTFTFYIEAYEVPELLNKLETKDIFVVKVK